MSKHTPGPWEVIKAFDSPINLDVMWKGFYVATTYAMVGETDNSAEANARLIAAAPDLLEALKTMTAHYCNLVRSGDAGNWEPDAEQEVMDAKAAIAKATGND